MAFNSNPTKIEKNAIEIDKYMLTNRQVLAVADIKLCEHIGSGVNGVASDFPWQSSHFIWETGGLFKLKSNLLVA